MMCIKRYVDSNTKEYTYRNRYAKILFIFAMAIIFVIGILVARKDSSSVSQLDNTTYVHGSLAYVGISDLFDRSSVIAEGTVLGKGDSFQIQAVSGGIMNHTDISFEAASVLRGSADLQGKPLTIRVKGGTVNGYTEIYSGTPELEIGEKYLLFLYQPKRGGAFHTEGDYYYVTGLIQGTFSQNDKGQYVSQAGELLTNDDLIQTIDAELPDENYFRNQYIENQRGNLENGFLTQEEFDTLMENIDQYATILD
ncbi:MAG: hypothetical protein HFF53_06875 [Lawsonibacter sp.]|nr:hypothetical protein [Lawsonibacter sp.]